MAENPVALVVGAGDSTGGAVARRFAREGFETCVVRRKRENCEPLVAEIEAAGGVGHPFGVDAREEDAVIAMFDEIETNIGPIEAFVFNIGANARASILDETAKRYFKIWELSCFAGFLTGREAARRMTPRGRGTIIFTGATASLRGRTLFSGFAGAKHALRALAQSMARELGPKGVHVAHVIIDGAIDTAFVRDNFPERYALKEQDGIADPDHIAEAYWQIHRQPRDTWTFELDLRPWIEPW